jgi:hypothetical protein
MATKKTSSWRGFKMSSVHLDNLRMVHKSRLIDISAEIKTQFPTKRKKNLRIN